VDARARGEIPETPKEREGRTEREKLPRSGERKGKRIFTWLPGCNGMGGAADENSKVCEPGTQTQSEKNRRKGEVGKYEK